MSGKGFLRVRVAAIRGLDAADALGNPISPYAVVNHGATQSQADGQGAAPLKSTLAVLSANEAGPGNQQLWTFGDFVVSIAGFDTANPSAVGIEVWNTDAQSFGGKAIASLQLPETAWREGGDATQWYKPSDTQVPELELQVVTTFEAVERSPQPEAAAEPEAGPAKEASKPPARATEAGPASKPDETKPTPADESSTSEATKEAAKVEEAKPEPTADEAKPEEAKTEEAKAEPKTEEAKAEPKAEEAKPEPKAEEAKPEPKTEEAKPEPKAEEAKPEPKAEEAKPEPKAEEAKAEPKAEEAKPEEAKADEAPKTGEAQPAPAKKEEPKATNESKPAPKPVKEQAKPAAAKKDEAKPDAKEKPAASEKPKTAATPRKPSEAKKSGDSGRAKPQADTNDNAPPPRKPPVPHFPHPQSPRVQEPPPYEIRDDILDPSYNRLSNVPAHPPISITPRRPEPLSRTTGPQPGPGKYFHELPWTRGGVRMVPASSHSRRPIEPMAPPFYDVRKSWDSALSPKLTSRGHDIAEHLNLTSPGPGVYCPTNGTIESKLAAVLANFEGTKRSTFGTTHKAARPSEVPGPGAYELEPLPGTPRKNMPGAVMVSRHEGVTVFNTPGPGEYKIPGIGDSRQGQLTMTLKGRLPHPMDAKRADFEAAKTSHPRMPERPMRARPRL